MKPQIPQKRSIDIELGIKWSTETRAPTVGSTILIDEEIGLKGAKSPVSDLAPDRRDPVTIDDRRRVIIWVIDPPGGAMRPIETDTVAHLSTQQNVARDAERLGLGVQKRILDRPQSLGDYPAVGWPRYAYQFRVEPLVGVHGRADYSAGESLDHGTHARRPKSLIEFAPAGDPFVG